MKIIKMCAVTLIVVFLSSCVTSENSDNSTECAYSQLDGEQGREYMENYIATSFFEIFSEEVDKAALKLEYLANQLETRNCKLADGRSPLNFVYSGFGKAFKLIEVKESVLAKLKEIRRSHPNQAYPILAEALFWNHYAWQARGTGYASTVTPAGWELFRERLSVADKILTQNKKISSESAVWYHLMYYSIFHLEYSQENTEKYYLEGFRRYNNFLRLYIHKRNQLRPRWGGSWQAVDDFINWSAENTKNNEGMGMYARLYFGVYDNLKRNESLYRDTLADWGKLKDGLRDLVRIYPNSLFHRNIFALMACEANDKNAYKEIRTKISSNAKWKWSQKHSVKSCDHTFGVES